MNQTVNDIKGVSGGKATVFQPGQRPRANLDVMAAISKMVRPRETPIVQPSDPNAALTGTSTGIDQISKSIIARIDDNENIIRLFPDIELAIQIIVSSILSPKDMIKSDLIYRLKDTNLPEEMTAAMVTIVKRDLEDVYSIKRDAADILRDALFKSGSHVRAILPESAVDQLINQKTTISAESFYSPDIFLAAPAEGGKEQLKPLGFLADPRPASVKSVQARESLYTRFVAAPTYDASAYIPDDQVKRVNALLGSDSDTEKLIGHMAKLIGETLEITDNFLALKIPSLLEIAGKQRTDEILGNTLQNASRRFVQESYHQFTEKEKTKMTGRELGAMLYKPSNTEYKPFLNVPTQYTLKRRSIGRPLVLNIPSEAAIPVFVPGDPSKHVGYFIPIDMDGNPITFSSTQTDGSQGLESLLHADKSGSSASSLLTEKARMNIHGDGQMPMIDRMAELYADLVESDTLERLAKGSYGKKLSMSRNTELYRIMLSRSFQSKSTRLVYIPAEYVAYFAFNYHRNGVGKSFLDDLSNITSLRAMVIFSKVMSAVKSSISTTAVNVSLDPRDPDPVKTIELAKHYVSRTRQQYFPHGLNRVADLTDWIHRAGIEITYEGHPRLPNTKFNFESKKVDHAMPDDSLEELFRHQSYMHFGLSPEMMDNATRVDFATTVEKNSVLFSRRIMVLSDKFTEDLTLMSQKILMNDHDLQERLLKVVNDHKASIETRMSPEEKDAATSDPDGFYGFVLQAFIDAFEVTLPKPDSTRVESQKTAVTDQEELIDKALGYIFSEDVLPQELGGEASNYVEALRKTWKAALMRRWMADNNFVPEAFEITSRSKDGQPMVNLLDTIKSHAENVMLNIDSYLKAMVPAKTASDNDLAKINPGDSSGGGSSSYDEGGGGDDTSGGTNDFAFDNPLGDESGGAGSETPEENTPEGGGTEPEAPAVKEVPEEEAPAAV